MLAGGCYCGAVRYEVADEFVYASHCHCSNCRRATGFVGSKALWHEITDDLPQYQEFPP